MVKYMICIWHKLNAIRKQNCLLKVRQKIKCARGFFRVFGAVEMRVVIINDLINISSPEPKVQGSFCHRFHIFIFSRTNRLFSTIP